MLDIDTGSLYHPRQDKLAINRIVASLESIGLVSYVICTSSYSDGLHVYFPFIEPQSSWELAAVIALLLEKAGFHLKPGQLELFPNPRPYLVNSAPKLFNAHRLPLQTGSYLLNQDFQPVWSDRSRFVQQWQFAQIHNAIDRSTLKQVLKQVKRQYFCVSGKADKFINDLNAEIEPGWTGPSQTNRLLGRITMRSYIFHHVITGGAPLEGQALIDEIVDVAKSLPGYQEWCNHKHEIEQRAEEWACCIENSHYFHYGTAQGKYKTKDDHSEIHTTIESTLSKLPNWNQQQSEATREKIRQALADLLEKNCLPSAATARFHTLRSYQIGGGSLYRHRDLWHPKYIQESTADFGSTSLSNKSSNDLAINDLETKPEMLDEQPGMTELTTAYNAYKNPQESNPTPTSLLSIEGGENALYKGCGVSDSDILIALAGNPQQFQVLSTAVFISMEYRGSGGAAPCVGVKPSYPDPYTSENRYMGQGVNLPADCLTSFDPGHWVEACRQVIIRPIGSMLVSSSARTF